MVRAKKKWGQHWLASKRLANDLVALIDLREGDQAIEIGPGTGLLTTALLDRGVHVTAIEVDPQCADHLEAELRERPLDVIRGDIRKIDAEQLPWRHGPVHLVGNLPYNLSGPILRWTAANRERLADAHFMMQQEVADRITASEGSRVYGALSVQMQWQFEVDILKRLSPGAFRPPPKVRSAFLRLRPLEPATRPSHADRLVLAGFAQRRKTVQRALAAAGWDKDEVSAALAHLSIRVDARAEMLSPSDWTALAGLLEPSE
jgi:16S rRNA (adenine1518-N6/adenine1519-N6)-dimethyltransferase